MERLDSEKEAFVEYRSYVKRWFVLLVVVLLNLSGAMIWLTFVAVAYRAVDYYETDLATINWLSLIFNLCGIFVGAIATWVLERYGLKVALLLSAWFICVGGCLRIASTVETLSSEGKLALLFTGQTLAALGQPFSMYAPAKTASTWFPENQRALANTLGAVANPIGVVIAGIVAPFFVDPSTFVLDAQNLLITMACPAAFTAVLASLTMTSGEPPIPPSAGALKKEDYFGSGLKEVCRNWRFMLLVITIGGAIGLYSTFATLLEQILCPFGYTDAMAGICAAMQTGCGVIGAAIIGAFCDYTKQFSSTVKACYCITAIGLIIFCTVFHIYMGYLVLILIGFIGLFSFGIYPIGVELGAEVTHPVGVATSSGLILISGQIQSIVLVLILQVIGSPMTAEEIIRYNSQCALTDVVPVYDTTSASPVVFQDGTTAGPVPYINDLSVSVYICGGYMALLALALTIFFRPQYRRMEKESGTLHSDEQKVSAYENQSYDNVAINEKPQSTNSYL